MTLPAPSVSDLHLGCCCITFPVLVSEACLDLHPLQRLLEDAVPFPTGNFIYSSLIPFTPRASVCACVCGCVSVSYSLCRTSTFTLCRNGMLPYVPAPGAFCSSQCQAMKGLHGSFCSVGFRHFKRSWPIFHAHLHFLSIFF